MAQIAGQTPQRIMPRLYGSNQSGGFPSRSPKTAEPKRGDEGILPGGASFIKLIFYGTDAADETGSARLLGWERQVGIGDDKTPLWVPTYMVEVQFTLSTLTGVDGTEIDSSQFLADTVTQTNGDSDVAIVSPANDAGVATLSVDPRGAHYVEVLLTNGTAADVNAAAKVF